MTRIISGAFGGRRIEAPAGAGTRPTSDRVREALFGRLDHQDVLVGARVLDLYAGSGALGLEALSRGAVTATFVESDRAGAEVVRRNAASLVGSGDPAVQQPQQPEQLQEPPQPQEPKQQTRLLAEPVERVLLRGADQAYDLVLADPPYALSEDELADVLALLPRHGWLAVEALVVVERSARSPEPRWPSELVAVDERRYGETRVWWARAAGDPVVA